MRKNVVLLIQFNITSIQVYFIKNTIPVDSLNKVIKLMKKSSID